MKISTSSKKVRANEFLVATRGAKAALVALRRWFIKFRGSSVNEISIDRSANRENEINEARIVREEEAEKQERIIRSPLDEDELRNIDNENMENELRELMASQRVDCN